MFNIQEELKKLPDSPGVYIHKDVYGQVIYVGKAINLKNRVRQYFQSSKNHTPKVRKMVENIAEFEYITAGSEMEALILECNLIKKYAPKYNILLRDDKTYPYIKVTLKEDYPRILKTRRTVNDGSKYFGPYADAGAVNLIINLLSDMYSLKRCNAQKFGEDFTPCLNYHIHRCSGICTGTVDREEYMKGISQAMDFLQGRDKDLRRELEEKMNAASEALDFESAAKYRDYIRALDSLYEKQRVVLSRRENLDLILLIKGLRGAHAVLFTVKEGKLCGRESFFLGDTEGEKEVDLISDFIKRYYFDNVSIPKEILLSKLPEDKELLEEWLSAQKGSAVQISVPARGEKKALMDLVKKDADQMLKDLDERAGREIEKEEAVRKGLCDVFGDELGKSIHRVEAYDISNIGGVDSVGAMVVFEDGRALKKAYRRFKINTVEGADDTGSLQEMLFRRLRRAKDGDPGFAELPDLILMDGGLGQVHAAQAVIKALGFAIPVAGMAKDNSHRTRALVYEENEFELKNSRELFSYIGAIQEEVHRFAIDYHHRLRGKNMTHSVLDNIEGIGEKRRNALLDYFGSVENIKKSSAEEIAAAPGMNLQVAEKVFEYFSGDNTVK